MRAGILLSLITALALTLSCGGSSTGPLAPYVTPSTLSVVFTGDSSKVGRDSNPVTFSHTALAITSSREFEADSEGSCEVTVSWTICIEEAYKNYILYRSESPGISTDPSSAEVLGIFTDPNTSEYIDSDIDWATKYYYALKTTDTNNNSVWSNEDSISTPGTAPSPSVLSAGSTAFNFVELHWSQCPDDDFDSYWLYRSETPNIRDDTSFAERVCFIFEALDTTYTDNDVIPDFTYYYALMTANNKGISSWSNEISVDIPGTVPDSVVATVNVGNEPYSICSLPSGNYVYVTNYSDDNVSVIRTSDNTVVATVDVGNTPFSICSLPSGDYVYVANRSDDNVSVIRTSDNTVVATVDVGNGPYDICAFPSGEYVYVVNMFDSTVSVIRTSDNTVIETVDVGISPYGICSLPSGNYVYVTNKAAGDVSVIRTSDNTVVATVDVGNGPDGICAISSGEYVYVNNETGGDVSVIRTSDNTVVATVDVGDNPHRICSLPQGNYVYVTNRSDDNVSVICTSYNTVIETIDVGNNPYGICSLPSGNYVYVVNSIDCNVSVIH